jgi:hypothetical protein
VHIVHDASQREIHAAEPLVPDPNPFVKLKKYKSAGSVQILAELIQEGGKTLLS